MAPIRIILADDHPLYGEALAFRLAAEEGIHLCAFVREEAALLPAVEQHCPDVVLTELYLDGRITTEAIRAVKKRCPQTAVLGCSGLDHTHALHQLVAAGAIGFIYKELATLAEVLDAIRAVHCGRYFFSSHLSDRLALIMGPDPLRTFPTTGEALSEKELEIIRLVPCQYASKQIAPMVGLSTHSVDTYCNRIMEKIGVQSRVGIALYAIRHGICKV